METNKHARIRRELSTLLLAIEFLDDMASRDAYAEWPAKGPSKDVATLVAELSCAVYHVRNANELAGKLLFNALSDADREQAADAAGRG
jgi:hypothetical protein